MTPDISFDCEQKGSCVDTVLTVDFMRRGDLVTLRWGASRMYSPRTEPGCCCPCVVSCIVKYMCISIDKQRSACSPPLSVSTAAQASGMFVGGAEENRDQRRIISVPSSVLNKDASNMEDSAELKQGNIMKI